MCKLLRSQYHTRFRTTIIKYMRCKNVNYSPNETKSNTGSPSSCFRMNGDGIFNLAYVIYIIYLAVDMVVTQMCKMPKAVKYFEVHFMLLNYLIV